MIELQLRSAETVGAGKRSERYERAFRVLQTAHGERLRLFCLRLCAGSPDDAADLTQETWLAAYQGFPRFQSRAKVTTWLFRIALYRWRQTRLAAAARPTTPLLDSGERFCTSARRRLKRGWRSGRLRRKG